MSSDIATNAAAYRQWLGELKTRFRQVQLKAAVTVNTAMLQFYSMGQQAVAPFAQQPASRIRAFRWSHHFAILAKCKQRTERELEMGAGFAYIGHLKVGFLDFSTAEKQNHVR